MYTVLAIDDDKTTLGILESQLKALGYRVITEASPVKGLELAKEFLPEVILLDLNMPSMNGFEVIRVLRGDKLTKEIPVVILTVNSDRETSINALRSGAIDYICKPYDPNYLSTKLKSAIHQGIGRKLQNLDEFIEIAHRGEMLVIAMRGWIRGIEFQDSVKNMFNSFFIKNTQGKTCIFDIREIKEFCDDDVREFMKILSMFRDAYIKVVTGTHYGEIVSSADIDERIELFLSYGDLDHSLK